MRGTVYVIQQPRPNGAGWVPDLSSANDYGRIEYVFDSNEKCFALPGPSMFKARKALKGFNYETDYILWPGVGDPAALVIAILALSDNQNAEYYKMLYWDRKRDDSGKRHPTAGFYVPVTIHIKEKRNVE